MIAMDPEEYRKRYEAKLAEAKPPGQSGRRRAGRAAAAADERATPAARANAIAAAPLEEEELSARVPELLATLRNREEPLRVRMAALQALAALDFLGARFEPFRADYKQALRDVATDPEAELRESALELLAMDKDPYAQELLATGLERPKEALVPEAKAIQFLGYDDHGEYVPLVREVYKRARGAAREEALRVLATDPQSERLFARLLKNKSETKSVRRLSASGLQSLNPEAFEKTARKIVADEDEDSDIRAASLSALAHGREAHEKPTDPKLVETVQKLRETTRSTALRASARRFLQATEE
jgi:hypothetical protein